MELVVVNGASNISKRVVQSLCRSGQYNRVRLLDFRPYRESVYAFQREMNSQGVVVDKRMTNSAGSLDIALEGASNMLYFTHHYTSMVSDKNSFLVGAAKLAKKHGISNSVAVCPMEHDLAYTEDETCWTERRNEAQQQALDANKKLSLVSTDLVYGENPTHLLHYVAQCVAKGKIDGEFLGDAKFNPVHYDDLANAVANLMSNARPGHFAARGAEEHAISDLVRLIEDASGRGQTGASRSLPFGFNPQQLIDDFFHGTTIDRNMVNLVAHFNEHHDSPVSGPCVFEATGVSQEHHASQWFKVHRQNEDLLAEPSLGDYKMPHMN